MNKLAGIYICVAVATCWLGRAAVAQLQTEMEPLIKSTCIHCHDADSDTNLNFESLGDDLNSSSDFRRWERVFDRIKSGEMPPASESPPDPALKSKSLRLLKERLRDASLAKQNRTGRVPARRLTKKELAYTLQDLLLIDSDVTSDVPDESESGSFDTVGATQRISAVHMESYLQAADQAIDLAIQLGPNPYRVTKNDFRFLDEWHEKPLNDGGNITRWLKSGDGIALFRDTDYLTRFQFRVQVPGVHRISTRIAAYQSKTPIIAKLIIKDETGGARLAKSLDLTPGQTVDLVVETFLKPGDTPYITFDNEGIEPYTALFASGGSKNYKGRGLAIMEQKIEGPLFKSWPPPSTRQLFTDSLTENSKGNGSFEVRPTENKLRTVEAILQKFARRALRRPIADEELQAFVRTAKPGLEKGQGLAEVIRNPLRTMLSSPQFLLFGGEPGELDDYAMASRLSYFLWKSLPDETLLDLAEKQELTRPDILSQQVDRMLADEKAKRFVKDFVGQWLRINKVNATTPDDGLYPEFDELLADAIPRETELFVQELIDKNLSLTHLIDSEFVFVNRRLAQLYRIKNVSGQEFRKVQLDEDSPRGGVLTQAAILKTTANGTTTSPVMRGNFVLTNLMGTPPSPPPPEVGSIEPDTRGKTTIRDILVAHRNIESCKQCHRKIDPPGFALESFDPIGGFRTHYRKSGGERSFGGFTTKLPPRKGPVVDASGVTEDGKEFSGIKQFKNLLLSQKDQLARNFISQIVIYSTGGEIEFY